MAKKVKRKYTVAEKMRVLEEARAPGATVAEVLRRHQLDAATFYRWEKQAKEGMREALEGRRRKSGKAAVIRYALEHPKEGYRRLAWMMVDEDVAYLSPSSVYRILRDEDLLYRWKRSRSVGEPPAEPVAPNERWHTDLMYLRVEDTWYFLVTVLDAYSRYVVHWDLLTSARGTRWVSRI